MIPGDVRKLLNRRPSQSEKLRNPSSLVQYLIFSNIASFVYYYRLWNNKLTLDLDGIPLSESQNISNALLTQLLSTDSQEKVKQDSMTSAYMLDHLYFLSLFKDFRGIEGGQVMLEAAKDNKI